MKQRKVEMVFSLLFATLFNFFIVELYFIINSYCKSKTIYDNFSIHFIGILHSPSSESKSLFRGFYVYVSNVCQILCYTDETMILLMITFLVNKSFYVIVLWIYIKSIYYVGWSMCLDLWICKEDWVVKKTVDDLEI